MLNISTTAESTTDLLPDEVLQLIFSYLKVPDKLKVCLVCKKWLYLLNCKSLLKDIQILINPNNNTEVFSRMSRDFVNFTFNDIIIDESCIRLFEKIASHVQRISLVRCKIDRKNFLSFNSICFENLKVLKIIECDLWTLFPSLPNLSELHLSGKSTVTDEGIAILNTTMKRLTTLHLPCDISFDPNAYRRFYPGNKTFETDPSFLILSFPAVLNFIDERASTITELAFSSHSLSRSALMQLACLKNLHLVKIDLNSCIECRKGLIDLFLNQPTLKILNLDHLSYLNDDIIDAMCEYLPNVEEIKMLNSTVTGTSLCKIFQLKMLKVLDIGKCRGLSSAGFLEAVSVLNTSKLRHLDINCIKAPEAVSVIIQQCKHLTKLNLGNTSIMDEHVHAVSESLLLLESLSLCYNNISDYGLNGYKVEEQNEATMTLQKDKHKSISNLKHLKELELQSCDKITDRGAIAAIKFKYLRVLNLNCCINISEATVESLFQQNPSLNQICWNFLLVTPDMAGHI